MKRKQDEINDFPQRMGNWKQKTDGKKETNRELLRLKEQKNCSFQPFLLAFEM
jgi:hypothetical protein